MGRGTARSAVEGLTAAEVQNVTENDLGVFPQFLHLYPDDLVPALPQPCVAPHVAGGIITHVVRHTVELDSEFDRWAIEIEHERTGRVLMAELQTSGSRA